jgi:hypothetical protein
MKSRQNGRRASSLSDLAEIVMIRERARLLRV